LALVYQVGLADPAVYVTSHLLATSAMGVAMLALVSSLVSRYACRPSPALRQELGVLALGAALAFALPVAVTLFELLGLAPMSDVDGRSLLPEIRSAARGEAADRDASPRFAQIDRFWGRTQEDGRPVVSITDGPFRLIHHVTSPDDDELYDHRDDPTEQRDVAADRPERVTRLRARVESHLERAAAPWGGGAPEVEIEDMLLRQLRALGYDVE